MSKSKDNYGSRFLYAEDLLFGGEYRTVTVTIAEVIPAGGLKAADGRVIDKPTLRFEGKDKMLVLCKTNQSLITFSTGEQLEKTVGLQIQLQPREVEAFGEQVVAIRVVPPPGVKVRKNVAKRMGTKAVWTGPKPEPKQTLTKEEMEADFEADLKQKLEKEAAADKKRNQFSDPAQARRADAELKPGESPY